MHPPLNDDTKAFWNVVHSKKKVYPYWCTTSPISPASPLVRIPHLRIECQGVAYWAFKELDKLNEFNKRYGGEAWKP